MSHEGRVEQSGSAESQSPRIVAQKARGPASKLVSNSGGNSAEEQSPTTYHFLVITSVVVTSEVVSKPCRRYFRRLRHCNTPWTLARYIKHCVVVLLNHCVVLFLLLLLSLLFFIVIFYYYHCHHHSVVFHRLLIIFSVDFASKKEAQKATKWEDTK